MAYAPPPPPLGGGLQAKQAPAEPTPPVARKPRPVHRDLVVPAKVPEPVKPEEPTPPVEEATAKEVAPEPSPKPSAAVVSAPPGPGVPQGAVGGVEGGTVGGLAGGRVGGLGTAPALYSPREVMKLPVLLDGKPDYPRRAREDGITGVVMVYVVIGADGRVEPAYTRIQRSVPGLDEAAIESVTRWRFSPALGHDGRPVRVKVVIPVKFAQKRTPHHAQHPPTRPLLDPPGVRPHRRARRRGDVLHRRGDRIRVADCRLGGPRRPPRDAASRGHAAPVAGGHAREGEGGPAGRAGQRRDGVSGGGQRGGGGHRTRQRRLRPPLHRRGARWAVKMLRCCF